MNKLIENRLYSHFKGRLYYVHGLVTDSETGQEYVAYQAMYGDYKNYIRPRDMFLSEIDPGRQDNIMGQNYRFEIFEGIIKARA